MTPQNPTPDRSAAQISLELEHLRLQHNHPQKSLRNQSQTHESKLLTINKILEIHSVKRLYPDARITKEIYLYKGKKSKYGCELANNKKLQELLSIIKEITFFQSQYNILSEAQKDDSTTRETYHSKFESLYGHLKLIIGSIDTEFSLSQENIKGCKILADVEKLISHFGVDEFFQDAQAGDCDPEIFASM